MNQLFHIPSTGKATEGYFVKVVKHVDMRCHFRKLSRSFDSINFDKPVKRLAFCLAFLCASLTATAQSNPSQAAPSPASPTDPKGDPVGADVNLFTGTLNLSYDFGNVATLSGLNFPIRLEYSGNSVTAFEAEHNSGIPYGEGWRLADAGITVETYAFDYEYNELPRDGQLRQIHTKAQSREKGQLYWTNARLRLPGGINGRLVYKYPLKGSQQAAVYVLHAFETYVEAVFTGYNWEVTLPDGTVYVFSIPQYRHRNPTQTTAWLAQNFSETILPSTEVAEWHLTEIRNPNHANGQKILFEYDLFGDFEHNAELLQDHVADTLFRHRPLIGKQLVTASFLAQYPQLGQIYNVGDTMPIYGTPKGDLPETRTDVFLRAVTAVDALGQEASRAELIYHSHRPEKELPPQALGKGRFLLLSDPKVRRQDSLYSRKVVWFQGTDDPLGQSLLDRPAVDSSVNFDADWKRYQHPLAHQNPLSENLPALTPHNPYVASFPGLPANLFSGFNQTWNYWTRRDASTAPVNSLQFEHSVLESPRIEGTQLHAFPPGDLYELRAQINEPTGNILNPDMNFDVRIATGMDHDLLFFYGLGSSPVRTATVGTENFEFFPEAINGPSGYFESGYELFSTRRRIVKWNPAYQQNAKRTVTSNLFKLQNLPNEFGGFVVQIGPAVDNMKHNEHRTDGSGFFHLYNNYNSSATIGSNGYNLNLGTWFGSGAPLEPLFRADRFGLYKGQGDMYKGLQGDRFVYWAHGPANSFPSNGMTAVGTNQPTAVTRESLKSSLPGGPFSLQGGTMDLAHNTPQDTWLHSIEIERISKNPYMLDSVIFYVMDGPVDNNGRVAVKAFKVNHSIQQVPVLNNVNPAWPQAAMTKPYRIYNGDTLVRNIFQLTSVERLPVDTAGNVRNPSDWTGTKFLYEKDDPNTPEVNEALLLSTIYNELGGRTDFEYDLASIQKRKLNENVYRYSGDQSFNVIGKGDAEEVRVPVKARIVQDGQGGRRTDYAFYNPVFMARGVELDSHFGRGYNAISKSDLTWGYQKAVVYQPALNTWSGRARTESYFRTATTTYEDTLLYGRLRETRSFDAQGQLRGKTEISEKAQLAFMNGFFYHQPLDYLTNGHLIVAEWSRIKSHDLNWEPRRFLGRSYQIQRVETVSEEHDPQTGNKITSRKSWGYYDWELGQDIGGEYAEMYQQSDPLAQSPLLWLPFYYAPTQYFYYGQEPSWQVAWERTESDDLPGSYAETRFYYLYDIGPFINNTGTLADRHEGSFRPYYLCQKYGIRNAPYEVRTESWNGNPDEQPLALSTYNHYEVFRDVPGDFVMDIDSTNYGALCNPDDDGDFQRGSNHAVMYCFGEGTPVHRARMVNEFIDDPRYVEDQNGQWWHFPIEGYSAMHFNSFNSMPDGLSPSPDERCDAGFVLGPDSKIKYFGDFVTANGSFPSASMKQCDRFYGCETDSAKSRDRVALLSSLPHLHSDTLCDKIHGFQTIQAANDSLTDSTAIGARQLFIDVLAHQFFLKATYVQADTLPNTYLTTDPHNPDMPSTHMLWDTVAGQADYQGTSYRWVFRPPFPTIRTRAIHERNMHGLIVDESDARHLHTVREYAHGSYKVWFDSCGTAHSATWRNHFGLPLSVTVTDFESIEQTTHFGWHPTGAMKSRRSPNGELDAYVYDERGRLVRRDLNGTRREAHGYGIWGGNTADTWARRTQLNFSETIVYRDQFLPRAKTLTYADPTGKLVQGIAAEYKVGGWQKTFTGKQGLDAWGRTIWTERPQVKYGQANVDFDDNLPAMPRRHTVYEDAMSSRELKSSKYGNAINGPHVTESAYSIISLADFKQESGATNAEIAELFPFWSGAGALPSIHVHRTYSEDEDGRKGITYADGGGRTIASLDFDGTSVDERVLTLFVTDAGGRTVKVIDPMKKATTSKYNVLGWPYESHTPDGGMVKMQYNQAGDLRIVQDEVRRAKDRYLCATFDRLGRVTEEYTAKIVPRTIGGNITMDSLYFSPSNTYSFASILTVIDELQLAIGDDNNTGLMFNSINSQYAFPFLQPFPYSVSFLAKHRYDHDLDTAFVGVPAPPAGLIHPTAQSIVSGQERLNGRASCSMTYDGGDLVQLSWVNYDEEGNLAWLLRQFNPRGITASDRGRVDQVRYPAHDLQGAVKRVEVDLRADLVADFTQSYDYDVWGRIDKVYVNVGGSDHLAADYVYDDATGNLAKVRYYANGAGAPVSLLADSIVYYRDHQDRLVEMGSKYLDFALYYDGNAPSDVRSQQNWSGLPNGIKALYKVAGTDAVVRFSQPTNYGYEYDGLGRLIRADAKLAAGKISGLGYPDNKPFGGSLGALRDAWMGDGKYAYDKAGNILGLWRYGFRDPGTQPSGPAGDSWIYSYTAGTNRLAALNQLGNVQASLAYDALGNLVSDTRRGISGMEWDAQHRNTAYAMAGDSVRHVYGGSGARMYKETSGTALKRTYYFNGPGGSTLAIWNDSTWTFPVYGNGMFAEWAKPNPDSTLARKRSEEPEGPKEKVKRGRGKRVLRAIRNVALSLVTGAVMSRESEERRVSPLAVAPAVAMLADELIDAKQGGGSSGPPEYYASGMKFFVKDYLGNVRVTERPFVVYDSVGLTWKVVDSLVSAVDYYPFGKVLRAWYGEGQERWLSTSHERDGSGLDYRGARYYDADYGRFLSLDPLAAEFPSWSPYNYVLDNPIVLIDPDGRMPTGGEQDGGDEKKSGSATNTETVSATKDGGDKKKDMSAGAYIMGGLKQAGRVTPFGLYDEAVNAEDNVQGLVNMAMMEGDAYARMIHGDASGWEYADQILLFGLGRNIGYLIEGWQEGDGELRGRMAYDLALVGAWAGVGAMGSKSSMFNRNSPKGKTPSSIRPLGASLESLNDVFANPRLLEGKNPLQVGAMIGETPGWKVEALGKGSKKGQGWVLREYTPRGGKTGRQIRWHPGGGHHGPESYWRVIDSQGDIGGIIR